MKKIVLTLICALAIVGTAAADQRLAEQFDYTVGNLTTVSSPEWTAHSSGGTNPIQVVSGSLAYTGLTDVAGGAVTFTNSGEDVNRAFSDIATTETTAYYSAIVNIATAAAAGDYFMHLTDNGPSTNYRARLFVRDSSGAAQFGIRFSSGDTVQYMAGTVPYNTPTLVVVKVTSVAGVDNDTADLFIDPALDAAEPAAVATATTLAASGHDFTVLNRINIRQGTASNNVTGSIDTIRVGTAWADVTSSVAPVELSVFSAN